MSSQEVERRRVGMEAKSATKDREKALKRVRQKESSEPEKRF